MSILKGPSARITVMAVVAIAVILDLFVDIPPFNDAVGVITTWGVIISGFMVFLGGLYVVRFQLKHVINRSPDQWYYSVWTILILVITFAFGFASLYVPGVKDSYSVFTSDIFGPLSNSAWAIIGFFFASALFRAFRGKNIYVAVFVVATAFQIFENAPVGPIIHPALPLIALWIRNVPNVAGSRGIVIGTAIGIIASGFRTIIGAERRGAMEEGGE